MSKEHFTIDIAGYGFAIHAGDFTISPLEDAISGGFIRQSPAHDEGSIPIEFSSDPMPDSVGMDCILNCDDVWRIFRDPLSMRLIMVMQPPVFKTPLWTAVIEPRFQSAVVYPGKSMQDVPDPSRQLFNAVYYRLINVMLIHILAENRGAMIHSAGIDLSDQAFIFPGKSGAGKSTITHQFSAVKDFQIMSDDRIVARQHGNEIMAYGTPWSGTQKGAANICAPLSGMFFIVQGSANRISRIEPKDALIRLLPAVTIPYYDRDSVSPVLTFCETLVNKVPAYEFVFRPEVEAVKLFKSMFQQGSFRKKS